MLCIEISHPENLCRIAAMDALPVIFSLVLMSLILAPSSATDQSKTVETQCQGLVSYKLELEGRWSDKVFPKQYPYHRPPAQWSKLIGEYRYSKKLAILYFGENWEIFVMGGKRGQFQFHPHGLTHNWWQKSRNLTSLHSGSPTHLDLYLLSGSSRGKWGPGLGPDGSPGGARYNLVLVLLRKVTK